MNHSEPLLFCPVTTQRASTKDPSLPIQTSDHAMLARCAALALFEKKLTRACKVQAQINSSRFIEQEKLSRFHYKQKISGDHLSLIR
ncbi:hypothetical protein J6590_079595 [Homalodisca vitripennis]|nr:hypothetical protein J6590_079595 [Homalodisca vitripennis]